MREKLLGLTAEPLPVGVRRGVMEHNHEPRIAFLFTGQGAQYAGMGRALYETQPTFRRAMDRCADCLDRVLDRPLHTLLDPQAGSLLDQTGYTQPVMFALEYALAALWRSWGVEPAAVMGHSVGEFAAACIAGVYELEDGLRLIAERARLMQSLPAGGLMAAVFASPEQVAELLKASAAEVCVAALNGPQSVVISGADAAVRQLLAAFESQGVKSKPLVTSHAFHSHLLDPILAPLGDFAGSLPSQPPQIKLISNLTGQVADERTYADPGYWVRHARSPVQFAAGMQTLADCGCDVFLEIGPSPTLIGMGQRCLTGESLRWLPSLRPGRDDWQTLLESLAELYVTGVPIDWIGFDRDYQRRRRELPTYPFQRKRYWAKSAEQSLQVSVSAVRGGARCILCWAAGWRPRSRIRYSSRSWPPIARRSWRTTKSKASWSCRERRTWRWPWQLRSRCTARRGTCAKPRWWNRCCWTNRPKTVQTILTPEGDNAAAFRIVSLDGDGSDDEPSFTTHAVGRLEAPAAAAPPVIDIPAQQARFTGPPFDDAWRTEALRKSGLEPGPSFCWAKLHWCHEQDALAELRGPRDSDHAAGYHVHPGLLDSAFQLLGAALPGAGTGIDAYVPMTVQRLRLHDRLGQPAWFLASSTSLQRDFAIGNVVVADAEGRVLMEVEGLRLRRVPRDWLARLVAEPVQDWTYELAWQKQPAEIDAAGGASVEPGRWLIFDSQDGLGAALAQRLEMKAQACQVVSAADAESRRAEVQAYLSDSLLAGTRHRLLDGAGRERAGRRQGAGLRRRAQLRLGWRPGCSAGRLRGARGTAAASLAGDTRRPGRRRNRAAVGAGPIAPVGSGPRDRLRTSGTRLHADRSRCGAAGGGSGSVGRGNLVRGSRGPGCVPRRRAVRHAVAVGPSRGGR